MKGTLDTRIDPFGVPLMIHFTVGIWPLLLVGKVSLPVAMATTLVVMLSIVFHEYGHVWAAQKSGIETRLVMLHGFGGVAVLDEPLIFHSPGTLIRISLAGPAVSAVLAGFGILLFYLFGNVPIFGMVCGFLFYVNLMLAVFNLLPIFPMDGGRVLHAILSYKMLPSKAITVATITTYILGTVGAIFGIISGNVMLIAIMGVIIFMAYRERREALSLLNENLNESDWYQ